MQIVLVLICYICLYLGVIYLQYGEETKQIQMPNELTGADTIKALFVSAFPQHLTMKTLDSPSVAIYIKDDMRNMYYELTDIRCVSLAIFRQYQKNIRSCTFPFTVFFDLST